MTHLFFLIKQQQKKIFSSPLNESQVKKFIIIAIAVTKILL